MRAPLLVIDGDSFAHRAYHALPKTIRRAGGKGAGAILGFANYLLRSIATMDKTAPLPPLRSQKPSWEKAGELARRWQLRKLAERLEALGLHGSGGSQR
jgi:5'-3' exonuclease